MNNEHQLDTNRTQQQSSKLKIKNIQSNQIEQENSSSSKQIPHRNLTQPNKPRGATYDGNVCMICSDRASGFHYGVLACEGCKGFFKRVCKEKPKTDDLDLSTNSKRHCVFGGNCEINVRTRNRCQYCRIQKCLELGMSKDGIKLGRRSKKFKQNLNSSIASSEPKTDEPKPIMALFQDNKLIFKAIDILTAAASVSASSSEQNEPGENKNVINLMIQPKTILDSESATSTSTELNTSIYYSMLDMQQLKNIIEAIVQAHKETSLKQIVTQPTDLSSNLNFSTNLEMKTLFDLGLLSILNETKFLDHFNNLIENAVLFAKNVPYFMNIHETDRISLLKSSVFEIICVRHSSMYYYQSTCLNEDESRTDLATLAACAVAASHISSFDQSLINSSKFNDLFMIPVYDCWTQCDWLCDKLPQLKGFILMLADFYRTFSEMCLDETELAIFSSYLLFNTVDQTLNDSDKLTNYRGLFNNILINELEKKRSIYKKPSDESEQANKRKKYSCHSIQQWLTSCCKKLKDLNSEHAKVLLEYKQFVQFPDLYAELYNL